LIFILIGLLILVLLLDLPELLKSPGPDDFAVPLFILLSSRHRFFHLDVLLDLLLSVLLIPATLLLVLLVLLLLLFVLLFLFVMLPLLPCGQILIFLPLFGLFGLFMR
jgi:hypothetical protein